MIPTAITALLTSIGGICVLSYLHRLFQYLTLHFWTPSHPLTAYKTNPGTTSYALVTGSSAGIGLGIARSLAQQGFGVILLGHLPEELSSAAATLTAEFNLPKDRIKTLIINAQTSTHEQVTTAVHSISHLPISILANNVGGLPIAKPPLRTHQTLSLQDIDATIDLNTRFMARLTNLMLPVLAKQPRALILNVASAAGKVGMPWLVMYSATKAFNYNFSCSLSHDLQVDPATKHIDCLAIVPGDVQSQSNDMAKDGSPTAQEFGDMIVKKVDGAVKRGWRELRPSWTHDLEIGMMDRVLTDGLIRKFVEDNLRPKKEAWDEMLGEKGEKRD